MVVHMTKGCSDISCVSRKSDGAMFSPPTFETYIGIGAVGKKLRPMEKRWRDQTEKHRS